jgi:addiction module RelB/DinJ family antitoxin
LTARLGGPAQFTVAIAVNLRYITYEVMKMPGNVTYNIRIDPQIREEADKLYRSMGLSLSQAVNLFLTQSVVQRRLPIGVIVAEPAGEPPAADDYHSFDTWEQAKEWLSA